MKLLDVIIKYDNNEIEISEFALLKTISIASSRNNKLKEYWSEKLNIDIDLLINKLKEL